jgi:hypothetical protein
MTEEAAAIFFERLPTYSTLTVGSCVTMCLNSDTAGHSYKRNREVKSVEIRSKSRGINLEIGFGHFWGSKSTSKSTSKSLNSPNAQNSSLQILHRPLVTTSSPMQSIVVFCSPISSLGPKTRADWREKAKLPRQRCVHESNSFRRTGRDIWWQSTTMMVYRLSITDSFGRPRGLSL